MSTSRENESGIIEETKTALTEDAEVTIDKKVPGATFGIVALSYPVVLAIGALLLAIILWFAGVFSPEPTVDVPAGMLIGWLFVK